jgi:hypothetical protein
VSKHLPDKTLKEEEEEEEGSNCFLKKKPLFFNGIEGWVRTCGTTEARAWRAVQSIT